MLYRFVALALCASSAHGQVPQSIIDQCRSTATQIAGLSSDSACAAFGTAVGTTYQSLTSQCTGLNDKLNAFATASTCTAIGTAYDDLCTELCTCGNGANCGAPAPTPTPTPAPGGSTPTPAPTPAPGGLNNGGDNPCFNLETTTSCRLIEKDAAPSDAFSDCFGAAPRGLAERVLMKELTAGDLVLASPTDVTRVIVNQHAQSSKESAMLDIVHSTGTLSLTPDHVLLVDGSFQSARTAAPGAVLSDDAVVESVAHSFARIVNPVTTSGRILAAGIDGMPVISSAYGEWIAEFMLKRSTHSLSRVVAYLFPEATQRFYDMALEPFFATSTSSLNLAATMPAPLIGMAMVLLDALLVAGFVGYTLAPAAAVVFGAVVCIQHANRK